MVHDRFSTTHHVYDLWLPWRLIWCVLCVLLWHLWYLRCLTLLRFSCHLRSNTC